MSRLIRQFRRWPVVVGVVVVVVGGGGATWALARSSGSSNGSTQLVAARVTTVQQTVAASGTIAPAHEADLDFAVSGRVTHVRVKAGDQVHKGEALASVGSSALAAQRAAAVATVTADEDKVAADSTGTAQYAADEAALKAAKAARHTATEQLHDATLRATIAGTVTAVDLTVGQQVAGSNASPSSSGSGSSSQVVIQSSSSFIVNATVDDTQVSEVKKGQAVAITPAGATFPVSGVVSSISSVPSSTSGVVSFPITVKVTGHPTGVYSGASATLSITTKKVPHVLEIPTLAITYSGSTATVEVDNGSGPTTRTITVGQTFGLESQVLSGLKAGDKVVVRVPTFAQFRNGNGGGSFTRGFGGTEGGFGNVPTGPGGGSIPFGSGGNLKSFGNGGGG